jgi:uncharacterized Zn-binding protein involved in type VI secretion
MSEPSPQEKLDALKKRSSNKDIVETIRALGGVVVFIYELSAGYQVGAALATAYATGGVAAVAGSVGGLVSSPITAIFVGAWIAKKVHAEEAAFQLFGFHRLAAPGREPAHLGNEVAHTRAFAGFLAGLAIAVVAGVVAVGTGGLAVPLLIGAAGGFGGYAVGGAVAMSAGVTGAITGGSPNVFFEGQPVARVGDTVLCIKEMGSEESITEGSETIFVNGMPLARIGHKVGCGAVIQEGCKTIFADNTTVSYGASDDDVSITEQLIMTGIEVAGARALARGLRAEALKIRIQSEIRAMVRDAPPPQSLTDIQARDWYNAKIAEIDGVEKRMRLEGMSSKEIFETTTELRNEVKLKARELMQDQELAKSLPPPKTKEEVLAKYGGDYEKAIAGSKRTNRDVNAAIEDRRAKGEQ